MYGRTEQSVPSGPVVLGNYREYGMLRVFRGENRRYYLQFRLNGGEGGILLPPSLASHREIYTSATIPCVCKGYKHFRSQAAASIVSLVRCNSSKNGISGITEVWQKTAVPPELRGVSFQYKKESLFPTKKLLFSLICTRSCTNSRK
jgi:hypothetical protein